jgi:thiamine biosynthesis protein ThiS
LEIILNGDKETLEKEYNITELLQKHGLNPAVVTISLNGDILTRDVFDNTIVKDGDSVDILMFMGGGR